MNDEREHFELPEKVVEGLKGLYRAPGAGNLEDGSILAAAKRAGRAAGRRRDWLSIGVRWAVAAGIIVLVTAIMMPSLSRARSKARPAASPAIVAEASQALSDAAFTRTGDIRDAYFVARGLKAGRTLEKQWDVNADGGVDDKDVRELALAAVRLQGAVR